MRVEANALGGVELLKAQATSFLKGRHGGVAFHYGLEIRDKSLSGGSFKPDTSPRIHGKLYSGKPFKRNLEKERSALRKAHPYSSVVTRTLREGDRYHLDGTAYTHGVDDGTHGSEKRSPSWWMW